MGDFKKQTRAIMQKFFGYVAVSVPSFAIGYTFARAESIKWLIEKLDAGFVTILTGVIGFAGLYFVTWYTNSHNSRLLQQSDDDERKRIDDEIKRKTSENKAIIRGLLDEYSEAFNFLDETIKNRPDPQDCIEWIRVHIETKGILHPPAYHDKLYLLSGLTKVTIFYCLRLNTQLVSMRIALELTDKEPKEKLGLFKASEDEAKRLIADLIVALNDPPVS